ncbi:PepSY-associated TM helix domain-containing protein [Niastella populi]|uniref:PepSY-associated TM helix domain-containing protein n=1 Tax=Niastella populi TaxID=550983 RepID=UPI0009C0671F|nr:PepSY-associated TM helix domain-containing protein [Niastella populi]
MSNQSTSMAAKSNARKKSGKSLFRRINDWLHLWLGLASGLIVFILGITGCIYCFQKEITSLTQPYQFVKTEDKPYITPSALKKIAEQQQFGDKAGKPGSVINGIQYPGRGKAAIASYRDKKTGFMMIYMNPYSGEILKVKELEKDFFRIILAGHFNLWLPRQVGQQIICWATGIFVILLISGLIMWWPKNLRKANVDKSFKVKWKASFKRVNYDLHNVLGFYVLIGALIIAITGLYFGWKWVPKSIYRIASGGKTMPERRGQVFSDTTNIPPQTALYSSEDRVWANLNQEYKGRGSLSITFPQKQSDAITTTYNPGEGTFYKSHTRYFDQYTTKEIKGKTLFSKKYEESSGADKLVRMNYDIHIGAIGGFAGKCIAFLISLIAGSFPVTGFIIWWGKRKKGKVRAKPKRAAKLMVVERLEEANVIM